MACPNSRHRCFTVAASRPGIVMLLRTPFGIYTLRSDHCCLNPGCLASHPSSRCNVHFPSEKGESAAFLICDMAVRPMPESTHNSLLLN